MEKLKLLEEMFSVVWSSVNSEKLCTTYDSGVVVVSVFFLWAEEHLFLKAFFLETNMVCFSWEVLRILSHRIGGLLAANSC